MKGDKKMSIVDNYEINVAIGNKHYCKIQLPDYFEEDAEAKLETLRSMFGDHYSLSMIKWECRGETKAGWE